MVETYHLKALITETKLVVFEKNEFETRSIPIDFCPIHTIRIPTPGIKAK